MKLRLVLLQIVPTDLNDLYDSTEGWQHMDLVQKLSLVYIGSISMQIREGESGHLQDVVKNLKRLKDSQFRNVLIVVRDNTLQMLVDEAIKMDLLTQHFFWVISTDWMSSASVASLPKKRSNIVVLTRATNTSCQQTGGGYNCQTSGQTCEEINTTERRIVVDFIDAVTILAAAINKATENITLGDFRQCGNDSLSNGIKNNITRYLRKTKFDGLTGRLQFDDSGYISDVSFDVRSTYEKDDDDLYPVGTWRQGQGLELLDDHIFKNTFRDFNNKTLLIASRPAIPFVVKRVINNETIYVGFCIEILKELAARFKFNYAIVEPKDNVWGTPGATPNSTWNGIVGMVQRKEVLMGVGPITITSIRSEVVDFTKPYMEEGIGLITKKPDVESQKMFKMYSPFAPIVWGCIALSVCVVGLLLYLVNRYSPYSSHRKDANSQRMSLYASMWLIYGSYMEQGGEPHPRSISSRCILGFWWVFTILMASTYTANLAAFLTVTIAEKPINSLRELANQDPIKPLVKFGSNLDSLFMDAESGLYKEIKTKMQGGPRVLENTVALGYVDKGTAAFMTDRSQLEYIVLNDCEKYALADEIFNTAGLGFIVPENAPYLEAFSYSIMKMQEAGLMDKWKQKWWPNADQCSGSDRTSSAKVLGLDSLAGPFIIYLAVVGTAFSFLFFEVVLRSRPVRELWLHLKNFATPTEKSNRAEKK
ncbi:glutamate receptor ionotropic, delta-2-like [Gigantopelta aegis]|uniref:glutamate receptor ionotropic, delta-2-like n=1 Tax=Gigantopelta aegis TaxID=1735272 RepID=UPI001B88D239|nr:glutamate receptor ionotropic, delta-2-like [Gigantopelta aegis]